MASGLVHYCRACDYNTPVPFSASVFSQNHTCTHCGVVSIGLGAQPGTETAKKADMQQDELAALFNQSLNLYSNAPPPPEVQQAPEPEQTQQQEVEPAQEEPQQPQHHAPQPIIYASMAAHVIIPRAASAPTVMPSTPAAPTTPTILLPSARTNPELLSVFARHSIDIDNLSPGQLELFTAADDEQKLRLLELWRITLHECSSDGVWASATSLEQEEQLARARYERMQHHQQHQANAAHYRNHHHHHSRIATDMDMMTDDDDGTTTASSPTSLASPTMQGSVHGGFGQAEPYMLSGYEQLAKREYDAQPGGGATPTPGAYRAATDPVYKANVENQYGAFQAMREYEGAMGWFDDEMVM